MLEQLGVPASDQNQQACRERSDGVYLPITYLLAKLLEEMMLLVPLSALACVAVYFAVALQGSFLLFWLAYLAQLTVGISAPLLSRVHESPYGTAR